MPNRRSGPWAGSSFEDPDGTLDPEPAPSGRPRLPARPRGDARRRRAGLLAVAAAVLLVAAGAAAFALLRATTGPDDPAVAAGSLPPAVVGPAPVPGTVLMLAGQRYAVGLGPVTTRPSGIDGWHLLLAPVTIANPGAAPLPDPLARPTDLTAGIGLRPAPVAPSTLQAVTLTCRNRARDAGSFPTTAPTPVYRGVTPDACVVDARTAATGSAPATLAPGASATGVVVSSPVPDGSPGGTDPAVSLWLATTTGPPPVFEEVRPGA